MLSEIARNKFTEETETAVAFETKLGVDINRQSSKGSFINMKEHNN